MRLISRTVIDLQMAAFTHAKRSHPEAHAAHRHSRNLSFLYIIYHKYHFLPSGVYLRTILGYNVFVYFINRRNYLYNEKQFLKGLLIKITSAVSALFWYSQLLQRIPRLQHTTKSTARQTQPAQRLYGRMHLMLTQAAAFLLMLIQVPFFSRGTLMKMLSSQHNQDFNRAPYY